MEDVEFEWDDVKAESNLKKHGVSFEEGATIFNDPKIATVFDPDHTEDEDRYISIGTSIQGSLLVIIHTEREERIRLISCRKATNAERKAYEKS
jgi:uncharacterized DUF497 family protein